MGSPTENFDNLMKVLGRQEKSEEENKMFTEEQFYALHAATHGPNPTLHLPKDRKVVADQAEAIELALICAQDIVDAWPELSIRKLAEMTKRVDTLRQALEGAKK